MNNYNILYTTTLSAAVNTNYYNQGSLNNYNTLNNTTLSDRIDNFYIAQAAIHYKNFYTQLQNHLLLILTIIHKEKK